MSHQDRFEHARSQVLQWAIQDQFKAQLSVIHAGALLWHVRRFSTESFMEPFGIYISTLLLWAYIVFLHEPSENDAVQRTRMKDITINPQ